MAAAGRRSPGRPRGGGPLVGRPQVLEAAVRAIDHHGPEATMDDIAAAARVTKPIVYRTVGDKAALTDALSEWLVDRIAAATAAAAHPGQTPRQQFHAAVTAYLTTIAEHRNVFLFVNAVGPSTELFHRLVDRSAAGIVTLFGPLRVRAGLPGAGAATWGYGIIGAMQVVATMWLHHAYGDAAEIADDMTRLLWDGAGTTTTAPANHA